MASSKRNTSENPTDGLISALDRVSNDLPDPEMDAPLVWEFLWNDPLPPDASSLPPAAQTRRTKNSTKTGMKEYTFRKPL